MTTKEAVKQLVKALKEDEGYKYSWQANIAMAFKDEYARTVSSGKPIIGVHEIANTAAINFLNLLCRDVEE